MESNSTAVYLLFLFDREYGERGYWMRSSYNREELIDIAVQQATEYRQDFPEAAQQAPMYMRIGLDQDGYFTDEVTSVEFRLIKTDPSNANESHFYCI